MKRRPILDESSFEKLLTAAWVLQCERDRALAESNSESEISGLARKGPVGTGVPASFAPTETKAALPAIAAGAPSKLQTGGQIILPPTPSALPTTSDQAASNSPANGVRLPSEPMVAGALALAPSQHAMRKRKELRGVELALVRLEEQRRGKRVVKIIIPQGTSRNLMALAGPAIVLIVLVLLLARLFGPHPALSVSAAAEFLKNAVEDVRGQVKAAESARSVAGESSHLRVTDADVSSVVDDLSRYEMKTVRRQAQFGDEGAAMTLGMAYETGRQVPQNCTEAARWVSVAAEAGNAAAQYNLALRYENGDGVPQDSSLARKWMMEAARRGNLQAVRAAAR